MSTERFEEQLKEELESGAKLDFADVLKRIEIQEEAEELKENNKKQKVFKRTMTALCSVAAAAVVFVGAAGLLSMMSSAADGMMESESAYLSDMEVSMESEEYPNHFNSDESFEASDSVVNESVNNVTQDDYIDPSDSVIDKEPASASDADDEIPSEPKSYRIEELGITLDIPSDAYCTGRDVPSDFPLLESYGMTEGQLESAYKRNGIYFNAVWPMKSGITTELVVYVEDNNDTWQIYDMSRLSEDELRLKLDEYENYSSALDAVDGVEYYDCSVYRANRAVYIKSYCAVEGIDGRENRLEYTTVINGKKVIFMLIEHPDSDLAVFGESVSEANAEMMSKIVSSVKWDEIKNAVWEKYKGFIPMAILVICLIASVIIIIVIDRKKKKAKSMLPEAEAADSEEVTDILSSDDEVTTEEKPEDEDKSEDKNISQNTEE